MGIFKESINITQVNFVQISGNKNHIFFILAHKWNESSFFLLKWSMPIKTFNENIFKRKLLFYFQLRVPIRLYVSACRLWTRVCTRNATVLSHAVSCQSIFNYDINFRHSWVPQMTFYQSIIKTDETCALLISGRGGKWTVNRARITNGIIILLILNFDVTQLGRIGN